MRLGYLVSKFTFYYDLIRIKKISEIFLQRIMAYNRASDYSVLSQVHQVSQKIF